jgi:hypothetical protein
VQYCRCLSCQYFEFLGIVIVIDLHARSLSLFFFLSLFAVVLQSGWHRAHFRPYQRLSGASHISAPATSVQYTVKLDQCGGSKNTGCAWRCKKTGKNTIPNHKYFSARISYISYVKSGPGLRASDFGEVSSLFQGHYGAAHFNRLYTCLGCSSQGYQRN